MHKVDGVGYISNGVLVVNSAKRISGQDIAEMYGSTVHLDGVAKGVLATRFSGDNPTYPGDCWHVRLDGQWVVSPWPVLFI